MGSPNKATRRSVAGSGATGAGATSTTMSRGSKARGRTDSSRLGLAGTLWGATLAGVLGYLVGFFFRNEHTSPGETTRKLIR